jgi:3alpha(or 20beta)-hydroxysteroid dehydrogenase
VACALSAVGVVTTHVSSTASQGPTSGMAAYAASKAGTALVAKCAAIELGHDGIRVNSIHPGGSTRR